MIQTRFYFTIFSLFLSFIFPTVKADAPTGNDLLMACRSSLDKGFNSVEGMLCTWYVTPCDCVHSREDVPRVCLPPGFNEENLARLVIDHLKSSRDLLNKDAAVAANTILVNYYPCDR